MYDDILSLYVTIPNKNIMATIRLPLLKYDPNKLMRNHFTIAAHLCEKTF
jgi:hypothetical protein